MDEHLDNPTTVNLSRFGEETKWLVSTLRLWSSILSPQIQQSEARCWTWISIRLIKLFWPWKEKRQRLMLMWKKVITRLCEKPGSGKRTCFGPRDLSTKILGCLPSPHSTWQKLIDKTIEEKYLELPKKSVNRKNNRYLFTYLYIALFKSRNKTQNVLNISRDTCNMASDTLST